MARELVSIKPLKELAEMETDLDRLMDAFLYGKPKGSSAEEPRYHPVDLMETKNDIIIAAEMPGLDPEDFVISLSGSVLTIEGEAKEEKEGQKENLHLRERIYGPFVRTIDLPKQVRSDKIKASYENGVLTITLPKVKETRKRKIKIKAE
jgi:HSP20 family protein